MFNKILGRNKWGDNIFRRTACPDWQVKTQAENYGSVLSTQGITWLDLNISVQHFVCLFVLFCLSLGRHIQSCDPTLWHSGLQGGDSRLRIKQMILVVIQNEKRIMFLFSLQTQEVNCVINFASYVNNFMCTNTIGACFHTFYSIVCLFFSIFYNLVHILHLLPRTKKPQKALPIPGWRHSHWPGWRIRPSSLLTYLELKYGIWSWE